MSEVPEAARERFARLAKELAEGDETNPPHRKGMGTGSLFVGKKMFGVLDGTGALVLKLSPERVRELIGSGVGTGWHPGKGAPLKEHVAVGLDRPATWLALAKESRAYMATRR